MKIVETNKFFAWLVCLFPQWNPNKGTAQVWAQELPDVPFELARDAVIKIQEQKPSTFPPGVFEIIACFRKKKKVLDGKIAFANFWDSLNHPEIKRDPIAQEAYRISTGGKGYGQALTADRPWHERRYVDIYDNLLENQKIEEHNALALGSGSRLALEKGDGSC